MAGMILDGASSAWRLEVHPNLASTSDLLVARARDGAPGRLAIMALEQTAGRGSHGRAWVAPPGNLNLSLLLRPPACHPGQWALLAAVALRAALLSYLPEPARLRLKWPNDVLLDGAKLAGILVESEPGWLAIGIGVNLLRAPSVPGRTLAALAEAGIVPPAPEAFAWSLLAECDRWADILARDGFAAIRTAWCDAGHRPGEELRVQRPLSGRAIQTSGDAASGHQAAVVGAFVGLNEQGALVLRTASGEITLHAGEILV
jgi:BirA family biotin operon repressor/biotin-[acetyl-CoA-carboxylase] ligase